MGIPKSGTEGRMFFVLDAADPSEPIGDGTAGNPIAYVIQWRMIANRDMRDLTPLSVEAKEWVPGHFEWRALVRAFIETQESPGFFNHLLARVELVSTQLQDVIKGVGWIESHNWLCDRFGAQVFTAIIRMSGAPTSYTWS